MKEDKNRQERRRWKEAGGAGRRAGWKEEGGDGEVKGWRQAFQGMAWAGGAGGGKMICNNLRCAAMSVSLLPLYIWGEKEREASTLLCAPRCLFFSAPSFSSCLRNSVTCICVKEGGLCSENLPRAFAVLFSSGEGWGKEVRKEEDVSVVCGCACILLAHSGGDYM